MAVLTDSAQIPHPKPVGSAPSPAEPCVLRLFIAGMTPRSMRATANLRRLCDDHLRGSYTAEVIDLYEHPAMAREVQVFAVPTLVRVLPEPRRCFVGDLSDYTRVCAKLKL